MAKQKLEDFLDSYKHTFLALSIFILITLVLVTSDTLLSSALAFISAFISYLLMLHIISRPKVKQNFLLRLFRYMIILFVITFCVWVILNIIIQLEKVVWGIVMWIILMIVVVVKSWF